MRVKLVLLLALMVFISCSDDEKSTVKPTIETPVDSIVDTKPLDSLTNDSITKPKEELAIGELATPIYTGKIPADSVISPFTINSLIGNGINLGNCFEAPEGEGDWGVTLEENYFTMIADSGFQSVRVPIRWNINTAKVAPYTIDPTFFERIDWVLDNALKNNLTVIINQHHYDELYADYSGNINEFLAIWGQIAHRYQNYPQNVIFEILNEPRGEVTGENLTALMHAAVDTIRVTNPQRKLIVSGDEWGGIKGLENVVLPEDKNLIASIHYYDPHKFTHQGASWSEGSNEWLGTKWENKYTEQMVMLEDFQVAQDFSDANSIPIYLGEFGAYSTADDTSRALWTQYVVNLAQYFEFSSAYWEFCSGFGVYDAETDTYLPYLMDALLRNDGIVADEDTRVLDEQYVLVDDFENSNGDQSTMNAIYAAKAIADGIEVDSADGGWWYAFCDTTSAFYSAEGDTIIPPAQPKAIKQQYVDERKDGFFGAYGPEGSNAISVVAHLTAYSDKAYPYIGFGTVISDKNNGTPYVDISKMSGVSFWAKGEGNPRLKFGTALVDTTQYGEGDEKSTDWGAFGKDFKVTTEWTIIKIFKEELLPAPWSNTEISGKTWDEASVAVNDLQFINSTSYDQGESAIIKLSIDDIKLHGLTTAEFGF